MPLFVPAVVLQAEPQAKRVLAKYPLRYISPAEFLERIESKDRKKTLRPPGLDNLILDHEERLLIAQGTAEALAELKALIRLLDVPVKHVLLKATWSENKKLVMAPTLMTSDNNKASLSLGDEKQSRSLAVTPHLNADGKTITLTVQINQEAPLVRTVALGAPLTITFGKQGELTLTATIPS